MKYMAPTFVCATSPGWAAGHESPASIPTAGYRSVFDDYKPMPDEALQDWRQANDEMGRLRGKWLSESPAATAIIKPLSSYPYSIREIT